MAERHLLTLVIKARCGVTDSNSDVNTWFRGENQPSDRMLNSGVGRKTRRRGDYY